MKTIEEKESILKKFKDAIMRKKLPQCENIANQVSDLIHETRTRNMQSMFAHSNHCNEQQKEEMLRILEKKMEYRLVEIKRLKREVNDILKLADKLNEKTDN